MPCSYCHMSGHTIRCCNSPRIAEEYNVIETFYTDVCRNDEHGRNLFINYVELNFNAINIKAIGLKYMGGIWPGMFTERNFRKTRIIEKMWDYFEDEVIYDLRLVPDEVPIYAEDLLNWSIDRNPDNSLLNELIETSFYRPSQIPIPRNTINTRNTIKKYNIKLNLEEDLTKEETKKDCNICYEVTKASNDVYLNCGHSFCDQCIKGCLKVDKNLCAMCRCKMKSITVRSKESYDLIYVYCNK